MAEIKTKKNTDYSASAVFLCNPAEVTVGYAVLKSGRENLMALREKADSLIPQALKDEIELCQKQITEQENGLRTAIDQFGSYQDIETGEYALKQRKVSVSYDSKILRLKHPKEAELVIEETVNTTKINGLVKGGLLDLGALKTEGITKESESFVYIIK